MTTGPRTVASAAEERILGQRVHAVSKAQAVDLLLERATAAPPAGYVCLTNVHSTVEARELPDLRGASDGAYLSVPDGMPLVWILRRRGYRHTEKVTGIELLPAAVAAGRPLGLRHYLYGAGPGVASRAAEHLDRLVPGARVVGASSPPFAEVDSWPVDELRQEIVRTRPHVLWVGLGAPKQELWMARMWPLLDVPAMVGVGAAFDFLAGTKPAAPPALRHVGLEWLFRVAVEPRRLWRRYLRTNTMFVWLLVRERVLP